MVILHFLPQMKNFKFLYTLLAILCMAIMIFGVSAHAAGILSAVTLLPTTALQKVNLQTEEAWSENQRMIENEAETESLSAAIRKQNSLGSNFIQKLTDPKKDYTDVRVLWVDFCGEEAADCDSDNYCDGITGNVAGIDYKDYNLTQCIKDSFKVDESTFAGSFSDLQSFIVQNQNQKIRNLLTRLNMKYILFLHANSGFNRGTNYTFNVSHQTEIPTANFTTDLITDLIIDAKISKVQRPFIVDGRNLLKVFTDATFDAGNLDGKGADARRRYFDYTVDPAGFARAGASVVPSTFMVTPYAYAFVNKNYYESSVPAFDADLGMEKYFIRIPAFGITIDVLHQRSCVDAKKNRFAHVFNYTLHYDFLTNPFGCADGDGKIVTGILEYKKVA
jgi:hypothetical protein